MTRPNLGNRDLLAIAIGGVLGATARWLAGSVWSNKQPTTAATVGTDIDGFTSVSPPQTIVGGAGLPMDTLVVNLVGCLLLGALTLLLVRSSSVPRRLLVGAATGFCGSLTTFSTFAVEVAVMLRARPILVEAPSGLAVRVERDVPSLALYLALSIVGAVIAFWLGRVIAKRIVFTPGVNTIGGAT